MDWHLDNDETLLPPHLQHNVSRIIHMQCHAQLLRLTVLTTRISSTSTVDLGPDLQNILRQSYDYLTITPQLRSTYDGRVIYKTSYNGWKAFHR